MAKNKVVDAESAVEEMKNKKFGLSIQNIIALVTVLSTGIAGWYSFTGRSRWWMIGIGPLPYSVFDLC